MVCTDALILHWRRSLSSKSDDCSFYRRKEVIDPQSAGLLLRPNMHGLSLAILGLVIVVPMSAAVVYIVAKRLIGFQLNYWILLVSTLAGFVAFLKITPLVDWLLPQTVAQDFKDERWIVALALLSLINWITLETPDKKRLSFRNVLRIAVAQFVAGVLFGLLGWAAILAFRKLIGH